jgi:hypothetical protein
MSSPLSIQSQGAAKARRIRAVMAIIIGDFFIGGSISMSMYAGMVALFCVSF